MSKNENKSGKCKNCSCAQGANCNKKPEMEKKECDKYDSNYVWLVKQIND